MSTRATYRFIPDDPGLIRLRPVVTVYVHRDGYPEGAAVYLKDAPTVEKFIRKNDRAEVTARHEVHDDTEFRYDIHRQIEIKAYKRNWAGTSIGYGEDAEWIKFFDGSLSNFIETYQNTPVEFYDINSN